MLRDQTIDDLSRLEFADPAPVKPMENRFERVCWAVFWGNLGLALFKVTVGGFGYSPLLIIDGLNSAANAVVLTTIILSIQMSRDVNINRKYPYGKGKAQYLVTLAVGVLLSIGASIIFALSVENFFVPISFEPTGIALAAALISVGGNLMLLRFLNHVDLPNDKEELRRIRNLHTLNIAASTAVVQGILLAGIFGWFVAERMGGLSISLLVLLLSVRIVKTSLDGIMDRSNGRKMDADLADLVNEIDGVGEIRWIRTRTAGQNLWIDINVGMNGDYTMGRVDRISKRIRNHIARKIERIAYVTVHCSPL
ncbi:MAG TPA: cation diffusion facilitator family transporter [Deltaproteobacteria bacterium]|nr:cation diffusion facilitator family transporter [Deltaproteobacteria bacterium]HIJ39480.1 cation diffusion facilitator family transporter [Deltaproteobacteria bacterium]